MYVATGTTLGIAAAARFASHVLDDIAAHRWRIVGCVGALLYRSTRIVMWFTIVTGAIIAVGLVIMIVVHTILLSIKA